MTELHKEQEIAPLLSSYGLMTAERLLAKYGIHISQEEIFAVVKNQFCLYHKILRVPFKNVLNGIILQQAHDYYVYTQKLFVDYLLSGETSKSEDMPGVSTRELLEEERQHLLALGEDFHQLKSDNDKLIAESQSFLINYASSLKMATTRTVKIILELLHSTGITIITIDKALKHALIYADLIDIKALNSLFIESIGLSLDDAQKQAINHNLASLTNIVRDLDDNLIDFISRSESISHQIINFRSQFHGLILRTKELLYLLPEYKHNITQESQNKESINFEPI